MIKVKELIEILKSLPEDALVYAYEGEVVAIVIRSSDNKTELGYIPASPFEESEASFVSRGVQEKS